MPTSKNDKLAPCSWAILKVAKSFSYVKISKFCEKQRKTKKKYVLQKNINMKCTVGNTGCSVVGKYRQNSGKKETNEKFKKIKYPVFLMKFE